MDKPEDLLLLDVIEVDDEESYSDLIGGEDGLEMEDNTESEYFEEDSEVLHQRIILGRFQCRLATFGSVGLIPPPGPMI